MKEQIIKAAELLRRGELVVFPTDTVYGLGADATNESAILSVFAAKERPLGCPLIVHIPSIEQLEQWAAPEYANREDVLLLARNFWPGPLTIVVKKSYRVSLLMTSGQDTIGIRIPNHPVALALLQEFNSGIIGTSANKSNQPSPTTADEAKDVFNNKVLVLDGGSCKIGVESTIISLVNKPVILRKGAVSEQEIQNRLHKSFNIKI